MGDIKEMRRFTRFGGQLVEIPEGVLEMQDDFGLRLGKAFGDLVAICDELYDRTVSWGEQNGKQIQMTRAEYVRRSLELMISEIKDE